MIKLRRTSPCPRIKDAKFRGVFASFEVYDCPCGAEHLITDDSDFFVFIEEGE